MTRTSGPGPWRTRSWAARARSASEADRQKTGLHPDYGVVTLRNLRELNADHGERHLARMLTIRDLLGKPLSFPLLLGERLY